MKKNTFLTVMFAACLIFVFVAPSTGSGYQADSRRSECRSGLGACPCTATMGEKSGGGYQEQSEDRYLPRPDPGQRAGHLECRKNRRR